MAEITRQGIRGLTTTEHVASLSGDIRNSIDSNIDLSPETLQGQFVGITSRLVAEIDEVIVALSNGHSRDRSSGNQVDDFYSLKNILRLGGTRTVVIATVTTSESITFTADNSTVRTENGDLFRAASDKTIDGTKTLMFRAFENGPVGIGDPSISKTIVDTDVRWESVIFNEIYRLGRNLEEDTSYKARAGLIESNNATASVESIRSALTSTSGVINTDVYENDKKVDIIPGHDMYRGISIDANSVFAVVDGGSSGDVAEAIANHKTGGSPTSGARTRVVARLDGDAGTFVPSGTRASLYVDGKKQWFRSTENVGITNDAMQCEFEALELGALDVPATPNTWITTPAGVIIINSRPSTNDGTDSTINAFVINTGINIDADAEITAEITIDGTSYTFSNTDHSAINTGAISDNLVFTASGVVDVPASWDITDIVRGWTDIDVASGSWSAGVDEETPTTFDAICTGIANTFVPKGSRVHFRNTVNSENVDNVFRTTENTTILATSGTEAESAEIKFESVDATDNTTSFVNILENTGTWNINSVDNQFNGIDGWTSMINSAAAKSDTTSVTATIIATPATSILADTESTLYIINESGNAKAHVLASISDTSVDATGVANVVFQLEDAIQVPVIPAQWFLYDSSATRLIVDLTAGSTNATVTSDATVTTTVDGTTYTFTNIETTDTTITANETATLTFENTTSLRVLSNATLTLDAGFTGTPSHSFIGTPMTNVVMTNPTAGIASQNSAVSATLTTKDGDTTTLPSTTVADIRVGTGNTITFTIDSETTLQNGIATNVGFTATNQSILVPAITARWDLPSIDSSIGMFNTDISTITPGKLGIEQSVSLDEGHDPLTIYFARVDKIPLKAQIDVYISSRLFPSTGTMKLIESTFNYINNLSIGAPIDLTLMQSELLTGIRGIVPPDDDTASITINIARKSDDFGASSQKRVTSVGGGIRGISPIEQLIITKPDISINTIDVNR